MAGAIYRAEFVLVNNAVNDEKAPHNELSNPDAGSQEQLKTKTSDNIIQKQDKEQKASMSGVSKAVGIGIAATAFVANQAINEQLTSMSIQGDSVAARNLQNQKAVTNELLGVGGAIAVAAFIPGGLPIAAAALATKYVVKAIDYSREVREYDAKVQIDKYLSQQERDKIQTNSREFR